MFDQRFIQVKFQFWEFLKNGIEQKFNSEVIFITFFVLLLHSLLNTIT